MDTHDRAGLLGRSRTLTVGGLAGLAARDRLARPTSAAARSRRIASGADPGDGGRGQQDHAQPGPDRGARRPPMVTARSGPPSVCRARWPPGCSPTIRPTIRRGIAAATLDGLLLGCGDAVIGINPATDSPHATSDLLHLLDDIRQRYEIPVQSCVLSHVTTTIGLIEAGAPVDLVFQSIAGTEGANTGFGVEPRAAARGQRGRDGRCTAAPSATTSCTWRPGRDRR